eukprot:scaffold58200_cov25-Tisochrysis_lutea.AAC.2
MNDREMAELGDVPSKGMKNLLIMDQDNIQPKEGCTRQKDQVYGWTPPKRRVGDQSSIKSLSFLTSSFLASSPSIPASVAAATAAASAAS